MRVLIASDNVAAASRIQEVLSKNSLECPTGYSVSLELAADRASRLVPDLSVLVLPSDGNGGLEALREIRNTVHQGEVLAIGPATDPKVILKTLHEGADEFLDEAFLETELGAALARFRAKQVSVPGIQRAGRVISVLSPSGGSGSSMLASNLSAVLASRYETCGLIDLKLSAGDLPSMLDLQPAHTMVDLCDRISRVDQSMFEQFFEQHPKGIHLLAAPREYAQVAKISDKVVRRILAMARVRFPYVLIDLNNAFDAEQIEALWQSDVIVMVLRLDYTSIRNARRALDHLEEQGIGLDRVQLVANRCGQARQLRPSQAEKALDRKIQHYIPNDPARVNGAINKGVPVVLQRPSAKVSRCIKDLATSVNGRHQ